ncbi:MAG: energy transducer TonB [Paludibacteraceae bacterium]|nr:energy transducer TonB [Paludibacteraceae bacterium]MBQ8705126.1 energy transducer TonB [Paludibacteraceae bacterium]
MQVKKSEKASLEKDKLIYVLIGLVFTLSIVFVALEWTEREVKVHTVVEETVWNDEELDIQQTSQETPPPPPPPAVQEVVGLNVVEDNVETESIEVNTEDDKETEVVIAAPVEAPEEEEEEEVVFVVVEKMPEFPGGQQALFKYLSENVKYPVIAQENGIQGRVICQFVVNRDGSIVDVEVVRSGGDPSLDKEAVRVIKSMPKWKPGQQRGKPVRVKYTVPVNFKLQ